MKVINVSIAKDFTRNPGPRYINEGESSGQLFRQTILLPQMKKAIETKTPIWVNIDGTAGYGTSFLEEAFGGLIRIDNLEYAPIKEVLHIVSEEEPYLIEDIEEYLKDAYDEKIKQ